MRRPKPVPAVVEILRDALGWAESGEIREVFVWYRDREGGVTRERSVSDDQDLALELRDETIRLRSGHDYAGRSR